MYVKELEFSHEIKEINKAKIYLYLNKDETSLSEDDRNQLDQSHRQTFDNHGIKYHEGRVKQAVEVIKSQLGIPSEHLQSL